ncbi:hypothetical protein CI088_00100 [Enterococcus plantarum]|uniref:Uncharacterized protein n=1 Tax=Enterococcus plantarum TaxID=1077675 RepID=A0A2W3ZER1_9ENTE|nr:hypothetical protein [Enterococcus plantarum]PZL78208.1 hypothetical protein CI088_00100 [Enterococcus plantarum]
MRCELYSEGATENHDLSSKNKPIGIDWRGGEVLEGDRGLLIDGDIVLENDIQNYIEAKYGKAGYL